MQAPEALGVRAARVFMRPAADRAGLGLASRAVALWHQARRQYFLHPIHHLPVGAAAGIPARDRGYLLSAHGRGPSVGTECYRAGRQRSRPLLRQAQRRWRGAGGHQPLPCDGVSEFKDQAVQQVAAVARQRRPRSGTVWRRRQPLLLLPRLAHAASPSRPWRCCRCFSCRRHCCLTRCAPAAAAGGPALGAGTAGDGPGQAAGRVQRIPHQRVPCGRHVDAYLMRPPCRCTLWHIVRCI